MRSFIENMKYQGNIIEESLCNKSVLEKVRILETKIEPITDKHKTPWISQWTLHKVEIQEKKAEEIAQEISHSFDPMHPHWYVDYKNDVYHFIIYASKIFKVDIKNPILYEDAKAYGISLGIPAYQVDFVPKT